MKRPTPCASLHFIGLNSLDPNDVETLHTGRLCPSKNVRGTPTTGLEADVPRGPPSMKVVWLPPGRSGTGTRKSAMHHERCGHPSTPLFSARFLRYVITTLADRATTV